jgi:hypothetical protein
MILELVPDQQIVEARRVSDWLPGIHSIARFEFKPQDPAMQVIFNHTGFPEEPKAHLAIGCRQHYWDALIKYLQLRLNEKKCVIKFGTLKTITLYL